MAVAAAPRPPLLATLLTLGRVSNLPTVGTNALAGAVLAGGGWQDWRLAIVVGAMSLFYIGGMYLNDYFDREVDALERPGRPIPSGHVAASTVAAVGSALLAAGTILMAAMGAMALLAGMALAAVILAYDVFHKGNPAAPVAMGLCRALVYCGAAAAAAGSVPGDVALAAFALLAYVAGLSWAARREAADGVAHLWPLLLLAAPMALALPALQHGLAAVAIYLALVGASAYAVRLLWRRPFAGAVRRAVGHLIAGIALVDAAMLASVGAVGTAVAAVGGFALTLVLQRYIPGT
jgi:4-hydroxybenzoate polyprenyltransferase